MKRVLIFAIAAFTFGCGKEEKEDVKVVHHRHPDAPVVVPDQVPLPPLPPKSDDPSKKIPDQKPNQKPLPPVPPAPPIPPEPTPVPVPDQKPVPPVPTVPPVPSQEPPVGQR